MSDSTTITILLDSDVAERLASEAGHLGISPSQLAQTYVRRGLADDREAAAERRQRGLEALGRLAELRAELRRAGYPSVDAAELVQQGRQELAERTVEAERLAKPWPSS